MAKAKAKKPAPKKPAKSERRSPAKATASLKSAGAVKREAAPPNITLLRLDQLIGSSLNPRTSFPEDEIADLAASIAVDGLLQNLVVRPHESLISKRHLKSDKTGLPFYEVIAGGRRLRALQSLAAAKQWDRTAPLVACNIQPRDDGQAIALAIIENLKRIDVPPMEEAEGFRKLRDLDKVLWSTEKIGAAIGRTQRYVQQRIALVERLDPKVQDALRGGKIDVTHARALVVATPSDQRDALRKIEDGYGEYVNAERLTEKMLGQLPRLSAAIFPRDQYTGETAESRDYNNRVVLRAVDKKQFDTLQKAALEAKRQALLKKWPWVKIEKGGQHSWQIDQKYETSKDKKKAGAIILIDHEGNVTTRTGVAEIVDDDEPKVSRAEAQAKHEADQAAYRVALVTFHQALEAAVFADQKDAAAISIVTGALLFDPQSISREWNQRSSTLTLPYREHFADLVRLPNRLHQEAGLRIVENADPVAMVARLFALPNPTALLQALVAERLGSGDITPLKRALAKHYGIAIPEILHSKNGWDDDDDIGAHCRICGCSWEDACVDHETNERCHWAEPDLCSACAPEKAAAPKKGRGKGKAAEPTAAPGDMVGIGKIAEDTEQEPVA